MSNEWKRRDFLGRLSGAAMAAMLAGCGSTGSADFGAFGGTTSNANQLNNGVITNLLAGGGTGGGIEVSGRLNLADFGGGPLNVQTLQQFNAPVDQNGNFTTRVDGTKPQILLVTQQSTDTNKALQFLTGPARALFLWLPNRVMDISAESTAIAFLFLTVGVLTTDPAEAAGRIDRLIKTPSFPELANFFRNELPTKTVAQLLAGNQMHTLKEKILGEYRAAAASARELTDEEWLKQGGVAWEALPPRDEQNNPVFGYEFDNSSWRFVSLIRQELDDNGNETTPPVQANLENATRLPWSDKMTMNGANAVSYGSIVTGQATDGNTAKDRFVPKPNTRKVVYWVHGFGNAPGDSLPATIHEEDFGKFHMGSTIFFYYGLPLLDIFSGGLAGLAAFGILKSPIVSAQAAAFVVALEHMLQEASVAAAIQSLTTTLGTNALNVTSDAVSLLVTMFGVAAESAEFTASLAALAGGGITAEILVGTMGFLAAVFGRLGSLFGLYNFGKAFSDSLKLRKIVRLEIEQFHLEFLSHHPYTFAAVDGQGVIIYDTSLKFGENDTLVQFRRHPLERASTEPVEDSVLASYPFSTSPPFLRAMSQTQDAAAIRYSADGNEVLLFSFPAGTQKLVAKRNPAALSFTEYTPTAMAYNGVGSSDMLGTFADYQANPPLLNPIVVDYDFFISQNGQSPVKLRLQAKLKAVLGGRVPPGLTLFSYFVPLALSERGEIMGTFSIYQQLSGVFVYDQAANQMEILHETREDVFSASDRLRYIRGYFGNGDTRWRCFVIDNLGIGGGYSSYRMKKGNNATNDAVGGLATGMSDDGTLGGVRHIDGVGKAFVLHPDRRLEDMHARILQSEFPGPQYVPTPTYHTQIQAVGPKNHMVGTVQAYLEANPTTVDHSFGFGIRPAPTASNP